MNIFEITYFSFVYVWFLSQLGRFRGYKVVDILISIIPKKSDHYIILWVRLKMVYNIDIGIIYVSSMELVAVLLPVFR